MDDYIKFTQNFGLIIFITFYNSIVSEVHPRLQIFLTESVSLFIMPHCLAFHHPLHLLLVTPIFDNNQLLHPHVYILVCGS